MRYSYLLLALVVAFCFSVAHCVTVMDYDVLSTDPASPTLLPYNEVVQIKVPIHAEAVYLRRGVFMYSSRLLVVDAGRSNVTTRTVPFAQVSIRPRYVPSDVEAGTSMELRYGGAAGSYTFPAISCEWYIKINTTKLIESSPNTTPDDTSTIQITFSIVTKDEGIEQNLCGKEKSDEEILAEQPVHSSSAPGHSSGAQSSMPANSSGRTETSDAATFYTCLSFVATTSIAVVTFVLLFM